jgi:hypothetical protein
VVVTQLNSIAHVTQLFVDQTVVRYEQFISSGQIVLKLNLVVNAI